ncbi:MAG: flavodoxin family protein [Chloroflexota bacterium]|nr:MAG: flavodoxin family protein [Chloroflexota bacterium]
MKVIGICGSPRRGNTEWMLIRLLEAMARRGADTELILLRRKKIKGCNGCLNCEAGGKAREGICTIQDDMQEIYPRLLEADCLVFGTPVYFEMLSGLLKNFIDRTCPIWPRLEGKLLAGIAVAEEGIGKAVDNLRTYGSVCGMRWSGYVTALAKTPKQVTEDKKVDKKLQQLAGRLIGLLNA